MRDQWRVSRKNGEDILLPTDAISNVIYGTGRAAAVEEALLEGTVTHVTDLYKRRPGACGLPGKGVTGDGERVMENLKGVNAALAEADKGEAGGERGDKSEENGVERGAWLDKLHIRFVLFWDVCMHACVWHACVST